jgi:hypothetical protein
MTRQRKNSSPAARRKYIRTLVKITSQERGRVYERKRRNKGVSRRGEMAPREGKVFLGPNAALLGKKANSGSDNGADVTKPKR